MYSHVHEAAAMAPMVLHNARKPTRGRKDFPESELQISADGKLEGAFVSGAAISSKCFPCFWCGKPGHKWRQSKEVSTGRQAARNGQQDRHLTVEKRQAEGGGPVTKYRSHQ